MEILPFKYTQSVGLELHSDTLTVNPGGAMSELYVHAESIVLKHVKSG